MKYYRYNSSLFCILPKYFLSLPLSPSCPCTIKIGKKEFRSLSCKAWVSVSFREHLFDAYLGQHRELFLKLVFCVKKYSRTYKRLRPSCFFF